MKKNTSTVELSGLAEDAKALLSATGHLAEEKVVEARKRLSEALERGRETWERVQDRTIQGAKAADTAIREHPYQSIAVAAGVGALVGYLLARRH